MSKKSKFFRVAVEGPTSDGREMKRSWIQEIAATYNQANYGARIFMEHVRGINPEWGFRCYGDVIAVRAEENKAGKLELYAQVDPTPELEKLAKERQKVYPSIEVAENFAGTGKAYLMGLGITDSPASLNTDVLTFSTRQQNTGTVFAVEDAVTIELDEPAEEAAPGLLASIKSLFARRDRTDEARFADVHAAVEEVATFAATERERVDAATSEINALKAQAAAFASDIAAIKTSSEEAIARFAAFMDGTPAPGNARPAATGGAGAIVTDC